MGFLIGVFIIAIFADWCYYRIPNICILTGMTAGLIMTYAAYSLTGLINVICAAAVIFLILYPFYLMGALGAGDVKLFMMMGCYSTYTGVNGLIHYMLVTMMIAAAVSAIKMAVYKESRERLFYLARYIRKALLTGAIDEYQIDKKQKRCVVRLSIPAFLSLILMCAGVYA